MKDLTFRGHAQRKRFNPIQVPDQAQKILNESERVVRGMKDVQAANLRNRENWLAAFKEKNQKEEIAAKEKFNLENEFAEAYRDAEMQHYKTRLADYTEGLFCFLGGEYNPLMMLNLQGKDKFQNELILSLKNIFNKNLLFELQRINDPLIDEFENKFILLANEYEIPLIGSNNIKFGEAEDFLAHDALLCVSQKSTVNNTNRIQSNPELYFKDSKEMNTIFEDYPEIIENNFSRIKYEKFLLENNISAPQYEMMFKKNEEKNILFNYISKGVNSPYFIANQRYIDETKKVEIKFLDSTCFNISSVA